MSSVIESAEEIILWLKNHQRPCVNHLNTGLNLHDLVDPPWRANTAYLALYAHFNGFNFPATSPLALQDRWMTPVLGYLLPFQQAVAYKKEIEKIEGASEGRTGAAFMADLMPVFSSGDWEFLLLDKNDGQLKAWSLREVDDNFEPLFESLDIALASSAECLKTSAFFIDEDDAFETDTPLLIETMQKFSNLDYWR